MQIFEIVEKTPMTKMSRTMYYELQAFEVDTLSPDSPDGKKQLVDNMTRSVQRGGFYSVPLSEGATRYLVDSALPNLYDVAKDKQNGRLMNTVKKFQERLHRKLEPVMEAAQKGREYNHLEDLVFFDGAAGAMRAADILEQFATSKEDLSIKWDGKLAAFYGRDANGVFGLSSMGGWRKNDPSTTPEHIKNRIETSGKGEPWRKPMAAALARIHPILEASVPASFRGYVKGDVLYAAPMTPKKPKGDGIEFTPNQVTYTVDPSSDIGRRVAESEVGIALHVYYAEWGNDAGGIPIKPDMVKELNSTGVLALGQTYVTNNPKVDISAIKKIRAIASKNGQAINSIVEGRKGLADMYNILYTYINQMVKQGKVDTISTGGLLEWLPSSKVSQGKQDRIQEMAQEEGAAIDAVFQAVKLIMAAKNDVIAQLDAASTDIKATTNGKPGGEGYVSLKSKTKLVPRHNWSPK